MASSSILKVDPGAASDGNRDQKAKTNNEDHRTGRRKVKTVDQTVAADLEWPEDRGMRYKLRELWSLNAPEFCGSDASVLRLIPAIAHLTNIDEALPAAWPGNATLCRLTGYGKNSVTEGIALGSLRGVWRTEQVFVRDQYGAITKQLRNIILQLPLSRSRTVRELDEFTRSRIVREQASTRSHTVREAPSHTMQYPPSRTMQYPPSRTMQYPPSRTVREQSSYGIPLGETLKEAVRADARTISDDDLRRSIEDGLPSSVDVYCRFTRDGESPRDCAIRIARSDARVAFDRHFEGIPGGPRWVELPDAEKDRLWGIAAAVTLQALFRE